MLSIARVNLARAGLENGSVRLGDMYQLSVPDAAFDAVVIHQVLHYADRPATVSRRGGPSAAGRTAGFLYSSISHHIRSNFSATSTPIAGLASPTVRGGRVVRCRRPRSGGRRRVALAGDPLTVVIWTAQRQTAAARLRIAGDVLQQKYPARFSKEELRWMPQEPGPRASLANRAACSPPTRSSISDAGPPRVSVEFFPPKTAEMEEPAVGGGQTHSSRWRRALFR